MQEVVIVKKIKPSDLKFVARDVLSILKKSPWISLIIALFGIVVYQTFLKSGVVSFLPMAVNTLLLSMLSLWLLYSGFTLSRNHKIMQEEPTMGIILGDTVINMTTLPYFNPLRFVLALVIGIGLPYLLIDGGIYNYVPNILKINAEIWGMVFFIYASGIVSLVGQTIFMYWDGDIKRANEKKGSKSKVDKIVLQFKAMIKSINNVQNIITVTVCLLGTILLARSVFLPVYLFIWGIILNRLYIYSFNVTMDTSNGTVAVLSEKNAQDMQDESVEEDSTIVTKREKPEELSKEKILGEHWYLNDRKSVIEEPKVVEEEEEDK